MPEERESPFSVQDLLQQASASLPRHEAEYLLLHALGRPTRDRAWLRAHREHPVSGGERSRFAALLRQRVLGVPVAYLTGCKAFYGLELGVDARVLDPRPDTETLVDWALELLPATDMPVVADLGTGSGAIALALKHQRPHARVWATDASAEALAVAQSNAQRLGLTVHVALGDWLEPLAQARVCADLIVSNPPYIAEGDPHLRALQHEPRTALVSGPDGLRDIGTIVAHAPRVLRPGGWLLLEHGHDQAPAVAMLLRDRGYRDIGHRKDLAGILRCTGGRWPGAAQNA